MLYRWRTCRVFAAAAAVALLASVSAKAGYLGDSITVSLTVHTTGATDQSVWSSDLAVVGPGIELLGDSTPGLAPAPLLWSLDFTGPDYNCFTLTVSDVNLIGPTTVDPLLLTITGLDLMPVLGVSLGGVNDFGFLPGDISFGIDSVTVSVPASSLAILANGGSMSTEFCIVPEVSSLAMMFLTAVSATGLIVARGRKRGR